MEQRKVGHEINLLSNLLKRQMSRQEEADISDACRCGREKPVTGVQCRIIGYLYINRDREVFQKDLEKEFQIRRSTATGILQVMERDGLILRKSVARDARLKQLKLTDRAIERHYEIECRIEMMEERLTRGINEKEMEIFYSVVDRMKENMKE